MSAASNVYLFGGAATFPIQIEGEIKMDSYPALFLPEYDEKIKELFYLDAVLVIDDEQGNKAFLGMVKDVPGSLNYQMHNTTRWFKQRLVPADPNQTHIVMNDAGLNTRAFVHPPVITNTRIGTLAGYVKTKSAYYIHSDEVKWQYSVNGEAWTTPSGIGDLGQRLEQDIPFNHTDLFKADDQVYFRAQVTNAEGTFISDPSILYTMRVRLVTLANNDSPSRAYQDWNTGERINYYTDSLPLTFGIGTRIFQNDPPVLNDGHEVAAGAYSDGVRWYLVSYVNARDRNEITQMGSVTSSSGYPDNWPTTDPAYDKLVSNSRQGLYYEGNSKEDACINGQNQERPVEVWLRTTEKGRRTYYRGENGSVLTGYFHVGGGVYQFVGGARGTNVYACAN